MWFRDKCRTSQILAGFFRACSDNGVGTFELTFQVLTSNAISARFGLWFPDGVDRNYVRLLAVTVDGNRRGELERELLRRVFDGRGRRLADGLHGEPRAVLGRPTGTGEGVRTVPPGTKAASGVRRRRRVVQVFRYSRASPTVAVTVVWSEEQNPFPFGIRL